MHAHISDIYVAEGTNSHFQPRVLLGRIGMKGPFVLLLTAKVGVQLSLQPGPGESPAPLGSPVGQAGVEMAYVNKVYI